MVQSLVNSLTSVDAKNIMIYSSITDAYNKLLRKAKNGDTILVTGSFYTVAEVVNYG
jgi:folylpolyglutamate synthase/dihydropteroate synthase